MQIYHVEKLVVKEGEELDQKGEEPSKQALVFLCILFPKKRKVYDCLKVNGMEPVIRKTEEGGE